MALAVRYVTATLTAPETSVARTRIGRSFETNARTRRNVANYVSGALSVSPTDADGCDVRGIGGGSSPATAAEDGHGE